jgi:hypothetical protein
MGRSRAGLTTKIHAVVDANGNPVTLKLSKEKRKMRQYSTSGHGRDCALNLLDGAGYTAAGRVAEAAPANIDFLLC